MPPHDLHRAVARATGESVTTIRSLGFGLANPRRVLYDPEPPRRPLVVDGDASDARCGWQGLASR